MLYIISLVTAILANVFFEIKEVHCYSSAKLFDRQTRQNREVNNGDNDLILRIDLKLGQKRDERNFRSQQTDSNVNAFFRSIFKAMGLKRLSGNLFSLIFNNKAFL